ncbi:MAG TPA: hypothetical protein VIM71_05465 [Lacunisphaera sp.]
MKRIASHILALSCVTLMSAQQPAAPTPEVFVKGDMAIKFSTRTNTDSDGKPKEGATDKYTLSVNVSNSALFRGTIEHTPYISKLVGSSQLAKLAYTVDCDVVNPKNPAQTRNVGRLFGTVPIDDQNAYRFADGDLKLVVFPVGTAKGFETLFKGLALGKPPASSEGFLSKLKKEALNITRTVNGKNVALAVTQYDKMEFKGLTFAAGPVQIYPEAVVNGGMIYDYGRTAWYFDNVTITYALDGRQYQDKLTGNIRWIESANRAATGEGEYQFDVRVNEPAQSEASVFSGPADESAFFATDDAIPALTGIMKYKDTMINEKVTASAVTIDLKGHKLTKQQTMNLAKLLFLTVVVPLNAE